MLILLLTLKFVKKKNHYAPLYDIIKNKNLFHHNLLGGPYDFICLKLW